MTSTGPIATRYPGLGPRAAATIVDGILGFVVIGVPLLAIFGKKTTVDTGQGSSTNYSTSDPKVLLLWGVLAIAYYVVFERVWSATPGKFVLGLRVRSADGSRASTKQVVVRNVLRVVDAVPYFIPYALGAAIAWSDGSIAEDHVAQRRRRFGDRVAGTLVTYR